MEQHLWDYLYIRAAKEWCPNDKLRCVINMSGIFTHHKALAAKKKKKTKKERKKINSSRWLFVVWKFVGGTVGSDWPPWHLATVSWKEPEVQTITSGPRLWPVILEGRERCPTITATPSMAVAYCSKPRRGYNPRLADRATLSLPWVCAFSDHARAYVHVCVGQHVCLRARSRVSAEPSSVWSRS